VSTPSNSVVPRHAATVILLREQQDAIEVLVTRRHENMTFMGGMWVFPGGTLCAADTSPASLALIPSTSPSRWVRFTHVDGSPLPQPLCLGLALAAHREIFEETGVLLATTAEGHHCRAEILARAHEQRGAIVSQPERFATLLQEEHLRLDLERLVYWAHWLTPSVAPKRFDTRFFLARLPPGQTAAVDDVEATQLEWMTPAALIAAARDGMMTISRPTLYNLMELDASVRQHLRLDAMLAAEAQRDIVPVLPKVTKGVGRAEGRLIVMPWDREYHDLAGDGVPRELRYPQRMLELPARVASER
jgi:8-oxo-dGTP pyrophosphatase MutT (NUDIX family)